MKIGRGRQRGRWLGLLLIFVLLLGTTNVYGQASNLDDATLVGRDNTYTNYYWYTLEPKGSVTSDGYPDPINTKVPVTFYFLDTDAAPQRYMSCYYSYNNDWEKSVSNKLIVDHPIAKPGQEYIGFYYMNSLDESNSSSDDMFRNWGLTYDEPKTGGRLLFENDMTTATGLNFSDYTGSAKILYRCYNENWGYRTNTYQYNYLKFYPCSSLTSIVGNTVTLYFYGGWDWDGSGGNYKGYGQYNTCANVDMPCYWKFDVEITNENPDATIVRAQNGTLAYSVSNIPSVSGYSVKYNFGDYGAKDFGSSTSGSGNIGSGIDHKQAINLTYTSESYATLTIDSIGYTNSNFSLPSTTTVTQNMNFRKTHDAISIPGCTYPESMEADFDQWNKKVIVTWKLPDDNKNRNRSGNFYVYRYQNGDTSTRQLVSDAISVDGLLRFEDENVDYNSNYTYEVSFLLNGWATSDGPESSLTAESTISTTASYNFSNLTDSRKESSVQLSWKHDTPTDGTTLTFKVWRCEDANSFYDQNGQIITANIIAAMGNEAYATVNAASSGNTTTYVDGTLGSNCTYYWYRISVEALGGIFYSDLIGPTTMSGSTVINSVSANRGTYSDVVKVQWDVTQMGTDPSRYVVSRRLLGSTKDSDYKQVYVVSGTESSYFFEDNTAQPGQFYQYRVVSQSNCVDKATGETSYNVTSSGEADGFCQSRGVISGRITYGTGTAVPDARVLLTKNSESGNDTNQFYSLKVDPQGGVMWTPATDVGQDLFQGNPFTFQMYVRPDVVVADGSTIIDANGQFALMLKPAATSGNSELYLKVGSSEAQATGIEIPNTYYRNVCLTHDGNTSWIVRMVDGESIVSKSITASAVTWGGGSVVFGSDKDFTTAHGFTGYLDDIRLWSAALSDSEILGNYDRLLIGSEDELKIYWPMDEGVASLPFTYDYSKTSGVANENHGQKQPNTTFSTTVPSDTQLSLYGRTDVEGNYVIRGVPFAGEGTNYKVSPDLGVHSFSPQYQTRFVSNSALNHSGVDFEDVSSFEMNGYVYYENTNIPVEGAYLYVDGTICAKEGEAIQTDDQGAFTISVPIGDHYVTVKKDGHTFVNEGRFPKDPNGVGQLYTFVKKETVTFYDNTKVMIAGRVVGGKIENEKALGLGLSKANIGQAKIVLSTRSNSRYLNYIYDANTGTSSLGTDELTFNAKYGTAAVAGTDTQQGAQHLMTIMTDAATGEFAVEVPPLDYAVESISIPSSSTYSFTTLPSIDAVDVQNVKTDSVEVDGQMQKFEYVASMKMQYTKGATMVITDLDNVDGALGEATITGKDANKVEHTVAAYTVDASTGAVSYTQGSPLLLQNKNYQFKIRAYQEYVNYDGEDPVYDQMPMANSVIRIANDYAMGAPVCISGDDEKVGMSARELEVDVDLEDDELQLDSVGEVVYQFAAGYPKTVSPYTRGCTISMEEDASAQWTNTAIIIGLLPKGNDFVTGGPDKVTMILRDPGGSHSKSTYSTGHVTKQTKTHSFSDNLQEVVEVEIAAGVNHTFVAGSLVFAQATTMEIQASTTGGVEISEAFNYNGSSEISTTTSEEFSTSADWDYVGQAADVFIGTGTNYIIGAATKLGYSFGTDGKATFGTSDAVTVGQGFTTNFNYTQNYIENVLIPNLEMLRNNLIHPVGTTLTAKEDAQYVSTVAEGDENFGQDGYYTIVDPSPDKSFADSVSFYNMQISAWEQHLANNEKAKVTAINNRDQWLVQNKSFDSGSSYTSSVTNEKSTSTSYGSTTELKVRFKVGGGFKVNGMGLSASEETINTSNYQYTSGSSETNTCAIGYTLEEDGDDDALTIDVFKAPDGLGPIFVTKGGRTSAPYEDQEVTHYYQPGTEISAKTMQIEVPQLAVKAPSTLQNVPSGRAAKFTLELTNASETGEDCWFTLGVCDTTNPNGAAFSVSGTALGNGRSVLVPGDSTITMSLEMKQTDESILEYDKIGIRLFSPVQKDNTGIHHEIADTAYVSATFVPAGPDVDMTLSHNVLNIIAGTDLTLSATGYDINYDKLTALQMEYRKDGDNTWNLVRKFVKDEDTYNADKDNLDLLDAATETYVFNMKSLADGTYYFRTRSVCDFAGETVYGTSEEIKLVKDQSAPKLFGTANPTDGILNANDEISVTFNEDIVTDELSRSNFVIQAAVNGQTLDHDVALAAQNSERAAYTEANINLAQKDFSADMWVNYSSAGTLFSHGSGSEKFEVGTDADGHLTLAIGENTYTSTATLTKNKWVFLTFNYAYNGDTSKFSALFAEDATNTQLFDDQTVAGYSGNGPLSLGRNFTGAIQELTLWDKARSCSEAKADKDLTKKPSTPNLIGYWKMDEGDGLTATDYARNRHMTLPQSTWYLNNTNIAANFDGSEAMKLDISACSALDTDDYAMEMWFKSEQTGVAALFSAIQGADDRVEMGFNATGALTLTSKGSENEITTTNLRDNAWHHLALNVLRSGNATVYVDGTALKTFSASVVSALSGANLVIGAKTQGGNSYANYFEGSVDEIRLWKATLSNDYLQRNKNVRLTGDEAGLVAYYPFEAQRFNEYQQSIVEQSVADQSMRYNSETKEYELTGIEAAMTTGSVAFNSTDVPGLKPAPQLTNLNYSFVANERKVIITLTDNPEILEGCTVDLTVRYATDKNYNMQEDIHWTAYVRQNQLLWEGDTEIALEQQSGESTTFEATIVNESGTSDIWSLSGLPTWLTASDMSGTLTAQQKKTITFTVASSAAIGKYEQTIYLTGNNNISEPLTLSLKVKGDEPAWTVNTEGYQFNMNIVGQLQFQSKLSTDEDDIIAAFNEFGDCVGLARPQYESAFDTYFTMMTVYGNGNEENSLIFKAYDASTGKVYPVVETKEPVFFEADKLVGTLAAPFIWNVTDKIEQTINLKTGWNWISLYVTPTDMAPSSVMADVLDILNIINGKDGTYEYDPTIGWTSGSEDFIMDNASMYKLNAKSEGQGTVIGSPADVVGTAITVNSGMTWIGYPPTFTLSPADAFAGLEPQENDMVKNQNVFAVYSAANAKWVGTLTAMEPGVGYMYRSGADAAKTFTYPSTAPASSAAQAKAYMMDAEDLHFEAVPAETYPSNMTMIGQVVDNGMPVAGVEVAAYVGGECRATMRSDADGYLFLLVPGDGKARVMTLRTYILGEETELDLPLNYQADKMLGTLGSPILIDITNLTTGISRLGDDADEGEYYDLSGRKLATRPYQPGVYIRNGEKVVIRRK
ncbi:MAG: LamG domain-containing protein [Prevotella sp.]|nr:LamG domain-containing protein [Prevotella sp.]